MKATLAQIINSTSGLKKLVNEALPAKTAYSIKRIMDAVTSESQRVEGIRIELVKKYADQQTPEQIEKGEPIRISTRIKEFQEDFGPLLDEEVELNCHKLPFSAIENLKLTVQDLVALDPWFEIPADLAEPIIKETPVEVVPEAPAA